jgi:hypothetical protein
MKFSIRKPSINKRIAARTSWKRVVRHNMGFKAPRGYGWFTNPKRAAYNRVYNRTTFKADGLIILLVAGILYVLWEIIKGAIGLFNNNTSVNQLSEQGYVEGNGQICPRCSSHMILRNGTRGQFYGCSRFPRCRGTKNYEMPKISA